MSLKDAQSPNLAKEISHFFESEASLLAELSEQEPLFADVGDETPTLTEPENIRLSCFDPHSKKGKAEMVAFISEHNLSSPNISIHQYTQTVAEVLRLRHHFLSNFPSIDFSAPDAEEQLRELITKKVLVQLSSITRTELLSIFTTNSLVHDLTFFISELLTHSSPQVLLAESRWIGNPETKSLYQYIGSELNWVMSQSRNLGLINFDALRKLRRLKIRVLGASVAAGMIDLLVALGAENIECIDGGRLDITKLAAMPQGNVTSIDELKAIQVMRAAQARNPYGHFRGWPGFIRVKETVGEGKYDCFYDEFVADADLIIEVVDQTAVKVWTRVHGNRSTAHTPILLLADLGNRPIAGLEDAEKGNFFNQQLTKKNKAHLIDLLASKNPTPLQKARAAYLMVKDDVPADHLLQFLVASSGSMPFWSQTPIASRESAAVAAKVILAHLSDRKVMGKNFTALDAPNVLVNELCAEQQELLSQTVAEFLQL